MKKVMFQKPRKLYDTSGQVLLADGDFLESQNDAECHTARQEGHLSIVLALLKKSHSAIEAFSPMAPFNCNYYQLCAEPGISTSPMI